MKTEKNCIWNFNEKIDLEPCGEGVQRKIMAYADEIMCVENHFEKGGIGADHKHPHLQLVYVPEGKFYFTVEGETRVLEKGDSIYFNPNYPHGQRCGGTEPATFLTMIAE